jgi:hypothetical protein
MRRPRCPRRPRCSAQLGQELGWAVLVTLALCATPYNYPACLDDLKHFTWRAGLTFVKSLFFLPGSFPVLTWGVFLGFLAVEVALRPPHLV